MIIYVVEKIYQDHTSIPVLAFCVESDAVEWVAEKEAMRKRYPRRKEFCYISGWDIYDIDLVASSKYAGESHGD